MSEIPRERLVHDNMLLLDERDKLKKDRNHWHGVAAQKERFIDTLSAKSNETISLLLRKIDDLNRDVDRLHNECNGRAKEQDLVEQALGKALGYPEAYPDVSKVNDGFVCIGEHTTSSIAEEAERKIRQLRANSLHWYDSWLWQLDARTKLEKKFDRSEWEKFGFGVVIVLMAFAMIARHLP